MSRVRYSDEVLRKKMAARTSVEPTASGCLLWTGSVSRSKNGAPYGMVWRGDRATQAHRAAYELARGPIPAGLTIDHLCRLTNCVNPDHLRAVTMRVNVLAGEAFTAKNARKVVCSRGHNNWKRKPDGHRSCGTCDREWVEAHREELRTYYREYKRRYRAAQAAA